MELNKKQIYRIMLVAAALILAIIHMDKIVLCINILIKVLMPFIIGGAIAFILNIPLRFIENKLLKKWTGKSADKLKRTVSILLSVLFVVSIIAFVIRAVVPEIANTVVEIGKKMPGFMDDVTQLLKKYPQTNEIIEQIQKIELNWNGITDKIGTFMKSGFGNLFKIASNVVSVFMNALLGIVFSFYLLGGKERIKNVLLKMIQTYIKPKYGNKVIHVCSLLHKNFSNFISGQCLEAVILSILFIIPMTILKLPYALLISVLIGFLSLLPIVGAFIGCFVGVFLILVDSPMKAIVFVILFVIVQQVEESVFYPRVVGNKVGLPSILVFMAVTLGGGLFGVIGMIIFIPIISTIYTLIREDISKRMA